MDNDRQDSRVEADNRLRLFTSVVQVLAHIDDLQETVQRIAHLVKEETATAAVGVRLKQDDDYPFFHCVGLDESFTCASQQLCAMDKRGNPLLDEGGHPCLECRCGAVISGNVDTSDTNITAGGSYWSTTGASGFARGGVPLRSSCHQAGFESVALVPLLAGNERVGLLQLYDRRQNHFSARDILFLEELGAALGLAFAREMDRRKLAAANRELEDRNRELDEFTYAASHDLQEPLHTITTFAEFLRKDMSGELPERAARDLDFMVIAAERMKALIKSLLDLSRTGRMEISEDKVSLDECLAGALAALEARIGETGARIESSPLPLVRGNATLLTELFQNLVANAIKFAGDGPPRVEITRERDGGEEIIGVRDWGRGIDPKHYERIFMPFKRLHTSEEQTGSGIGLAICRKVVERHGGRLWVESEPGKGAHFRFTLGG